MEVAEFDLQQFPEIQIIQIILRIMQIHMSLNEDQIRNQFILVESPATYNLNVSINQFMNTFKQYVILDQLIWEFASFIQKKSLNQNI